MIRSFYGLTQNPFDRRELELLPGQQEILDTLKVHCQQGGLCLVLGVPGTGKSVIKQALQQRIRPVNRVLAGFGSLEVSFSETSSWLVVLAV
jgi:ABC-type transporter Mla maintaining outer membrane lipid asymmetry ATPase subunit MlaF